MISGAEVRLDRRGRGSLCSSYVEFEAPMGHQVELMLMYSKAFRMQI